MALGLGLVLGILIATAALCTVCCVQYWSVRYVRLVFRSLLYATTKTDVVTMPFSVADPWIYKRGTRTRRRGEWCVPRRTGGGVWDAPSQKNISTLDLKIVTLSAFWTLFLQFSYLV